MDKNAKRTCRICGAEYELCYACERKHGWKTLTDTEDHYYILLALMDYKSDHDAKSAYEKLKKRSFNKDDIDTFIPEVKDMLNEIIDASIEARTRKRGKPSKTTAE